MNVEQLLKVFDDILEEENEKQIQTKLQNLKSHLDQNAEGDTIPNAISELRASLEVSHFQYYQPSELQIVEAISASDFVGSQLLTKINTIVDDGLHPKPMSEELQRLYKTRKGFLDSISQASEKLKSLGLRSEIEDVENGKVGIFLTEKLTHNDLDEITKNLKNWNRLIVNLHELCGKEFTNAKVASVSNGSVIMYFVESALCLKLIAQAVEHLAKAAKTRAEMEETRIKLEAWKADRAVDLGIKNMMNDFASRQIEEIVDGLLKESEFSNGKSITDINEKKQHLRNSIKDLVVAMDKGLGIEIKPPAMPPDDDGTDVTDEKLKALQIKREQVTTLREYVSTAREIAGGLVDFSSLMIEDSTAKEQDTSDSGKENYHGIDDIGDAGGATSTA